jgi:hypothetical protein
MSNDIKVFIGIIGASVLLIIGFVYLQGGKETNEPPQSLAQVAGIQINPEHYELGNIDLDGGLVTKEYEVVNDTDQTMNLQKIVTSCMCTQAKVSLGDKESRYFGMEHPGDRNPSVNYEIPSGGNAMVTVNFDPAAHGPQGTGPFDRVVTLTFSEPAGVKKLTFNGTVVR